MTANWKRQDASSLIQRTKPQFQNEYFQTLSHRWNQNRRHTTLVVDDCGISDYNDNFSNDYMNITLGQGFGGND